MNEEKKVPFKWEYGEETISLQLGMYANNQRLYIGMITHTEDGAEAFADMTVNLQDIPWTPERRLFPVTSARICCDSSKRTNWGRCFPIRFSPVMENILLLPLIWRS